MELRGGVIAKAGNVTTASVNQLTFAVSSTLGGAPVDFTPPANVTGGMAGGGNHVVVISYIDEDQFHSDLGWTKRAIGEHDGDNLLEEGEKFQITIGGPAEADGLVTALEPDLTKGRTFTIEIKPPVGAVLSIERTIPARVDEVMNLN